MSLALIAQSYIDSGDEEAIDDDNFKGRRNATVENGLSTDLEEIRELIKQLHGLEMTKPRNPHRNPSMPEKNKSFPGKPLMSRLHYGNIPKCNAAYRCPFCFITFKLGDSLIKHLPSHSSYRARLHQANGAAKADIKPFFTEIRQSSGRKSMKCSKCEKSFGKKWRAARHIRSHCRTRPCHCIICHKS